MWRAIPIILLGLLVCLWSAPTLRAQDQPDTFDGKWILEISEPRQMPKGATVEVMVVNGRFSTPFSGKGWRGEVSGKISASGRLVGKGHIQKPGWRMRKLEFSAPYHDGAFTDGNIPTSGALTLDFQVTLRR